VLLSDDRFAVGPNSLQLEKPMTVTFHLPGESRGAGIYRLVWDTPVYVGGTVSDGSITASVREGGTFVLGYDREISSESALPVSLIVEQNLPNPFNPSTRIPFLLSLEHEVTIDIFDATGRKIATIARGRFSAGKHSVVWDARDNRGRPVSSGAYFYRVSLGTYAVTRKMLFLR
jgi:hypothetical protein